ncbi:hypothetical protein T02_9497 [Trichinella nativa]|uniref:Uncharacterized protein n=1 Tax=Trichinella nativa TaxID=6335 RepID=A0A0V1KMB6_9BILA|nr:hypothetical protein T02_9497 [Trichinella nativa]
MSSPHPSSPHSVGIRAHQPSTTYPTLRRPSAILVPTVWSCIPVVTQSITHQFLYTHCPHIPQYFQSAHPSITISMLHSCSPHFHRIICEDSPPHTLPPPTQGCVPHRHSLHQSFDHPYLLSPCHHPSISVYSPSTHSTCDRTIHTLPAPIPRGIILPPISTTLS